MSANDSVPLNQPGCTSDPRFHFSGDSAIAVEVRAFADEKLFRTLIDSNIIGIVHSSENYFLSVNDYFCQMLGYTRDELLTGAINWRTLTLEENIAALESRMTQLKTDGFVKPFEKEYRCKDGSLVNVLLCSISTAKDPFEWLSFVQDMSEHKRALNALKASEELNRAIIEILAEGVIVQR